MKICEWYLGERCRTLSPIFLNPRWPRNPSNPGVSLKTDRLVNRRRDKVVFLAVEKSRNVRQEKTGTGLVKENPR